MLNGREIVVPGDYLDNVVKLIKLKQENGVKISDISILTVGCGNQDADFHSILTAEAKFPYFSDNGIVPVSTDLTHMINEGINVPSDTIPERGNRDSYEAIQGKYVIALLPRACNTAASLLMRYIAEVLVAKPENLELLATGKPWIKPVSFVYQKEEMFPIQDCAYAEKCTPVISPVQIQRGPYCTEKIVGRLVPKL